MLRVNLRRLRRQGRQREAGALEANALACIWTKARAKSSGYRCDDVCPRCELGKDTIAHRLYECQANVNIDHEWVSRTESL
eukprot:6015678-Pyramimonas_sp.AAC.1